MAPSVINRVLAIVSVASTAWGVAMAVTGGFAVSVGPLSFRSRRPSHGFVVAAVALGLLAFREARARGTAGGVGGPWLERVAPWLASGLATCALAAGLVWGTWTAGGADSYGYVSQARLLASGRLSVAEPLALEAPWPDATWTFAPLGFKPGLQRGTTVPAYPPGLPLLMAAASKVGGEQAVYVVVPILAALAVWVTFVLGRRFRDAAAGLVAAALVASSPVFIYQAIQPMSDVPVVAWALAATVLAARGSAASAWLAGVAAGLAALTRPNIAPFIVPLALLVACSARVGTPESLGQPANPPPSTGRQRPRQRAVALLAFLAGLAPGIAVLAALQWRYYGSPFTSGYGSLALLFGADHIAPNLVRYLRWLIEIETPLLLLAPLATFLAWRRRRQPGGRDRWLLVSACLAVSAIVFVTYLFYVPFEHWSYLRFLLPALAMLIALAATMLSSAFARVPRLTAASGLALACGLLVWLSIAEAGRVGVFRMRADERKYTETAAWVVSRLPPRAAVLTFQQSGSLRLYAGRLTVRWDLIHPDWLDRALDFLEERGHPPFLLVEPLEEPMFRARFAGRSRAGALDWPPIARIGGVRIYDPRSL